MGFSIEIILFITIFQSTKSNPTASNGLPKLLIVSYDGFRHDYFERGLTPFLNNLKTNGATADYMKSVFVTKTLPNHFSIATGLYCETHGVVDKSFYDPKTNKTYKYSNELYHYNDKILPIWTVNEKAGQGRHSGTLWSGTEFEYGGTNVTFVKPYTRSITWEEKVDLLMSWFDHPTTPINLGMLYIEEPDYTSHALGINNDRFNELLKKVDELTKYLHDKIKERSLENLNIVHLSDHGMSTVTLDRIIDITKYIDSADYTAAGSNPIMMIYPREGKTSLIYEKLNDASRAEKHFTVYSKENIPKRFHYYDNPRIGPILIVAEAGYAFQTIKKNFPRFEKQFNIKINESSEFGVHGYDNDVPEMRPFFFGVGPAFVPRCRVPPFENVDLFPLFCDILNLQCPASNGTLENLKWCLTKYRRSKIID